MTRLEFDCHAFARRGTFVIVCVSIMHLLDSAMMFGWSSADGSTCLLALLQPLRVFVSDGRYILASIILLTATSGLVGALFRIGYARIGLLLPQHIVLFFMAWGGVKAALLGQYLDGTLIPAPHIVTDQMVFLFLFAMHAHAIWQRCWDPNG